MARFLAHLGLLVTLLPLLAGFVSAKFAPACPAGDGANQCTDDPPDNWFTCQEQKTFGKCNAPFMVEKNYCAETCGRCKKKACPCGDKQPSKWYTCTQQKKFGKCGDDWMIRGGFCKCTCGRCKDSGADSSRTLTDIAKSVDKQLREKVFPFWLEKTVDHKNGGYFVSYEIDHPNLKKDFKQITAQARNVWGFSNAHINGYSSKKRNYLAAAKQGYEFIVSKFLDPVHGGYYWRTDLSGNPINTVKNLFGQAFVIFGFVEYYRASGDVRALDKAKELFYKLKENAHDNENGGWIEDFKRDWTRFGNDEFGGGPLGTAGLKANAHLHLVEAFTELYIETKDPNVKAALQEILDVHRKYFFPKDPSQAVLKRKYDWTIFAGFPSDSYGRNVQLAWTFVRAERALGKEPDWETLDVYINHALDKGYDSKGVGGLKEGDEKQWWANGELLAALTTSLKRPSKNFASYNDHELALRDLWTFLECYMVDSKDGMWIWGTKENGSVGWGVKANEWKAMYHDIRARIMFVRAFKK